MQLGERLPFRFAEALLYWWAIPDIRWPPALPSAMFMNAPFSDLPEFSIGKPVRAAKTLRSWWARSLFDDEALPGQAFGAVVRSRHA